MSDASNTSNVVAFAPGLDRQALGEPNPEIVDRLEQLLAQSRAGQIQGFCFVSVDHEGAVMTDYFGAKRFTQLGGLVRLQHEINQVIDSSD